MDDERRGEGWEGEERREVKRRYTLDRRIAERRRRMVFNIILPTVIGLVGAALITWGAYVTNVTYKISAKYEETFIGHLQQKEAEDLKLEHKLELMQVEYTNKVGALRSDMTDGFKEVRKSQADIYNLLVTREEAEVRK